MKKSLFILSIIGFILASCGPSGIDEPDDTYRYVRLFARFGDDTKALLDNTGSYSIETDDEILVPTNLTLSQGVESGNTLEYVNVVKLNSDGSSQNIIRLSNSEYRCGYALFPNDERWTISISTDSETGISDTSYYYTFPNEYSYQDFLDSQEQIQRINLPLVANNYDNDNVILDFVHTVGMIRLTVNNVPVGTKYLGISFNQSISGTFKLDFFEGQPFLGITTTSISPVTPVFGMAQTKGTEIVRGGAEVYITIANDDDGIKPSDNRNIALNIPIPIYYNSSNGVRSIKPYTKLRVFAFDANNPKGTMINVPHENHGPKLSTGWIIGVNAITHRDILDFDWSCQAGHLLKVSVTLPNPETVGALNIEGITFQE